MKIASLQQIKKGIVLTTGASLFTLLVSPSSLLAQTLEVDQAKAQTLEADQTKAQTPKADQAKAQTSKADQAKAQTSKVDQSKKGCEYRTLNMKVASNVQLSEVLAQLSEMCDFSVVFTDAPAIEIANQFLHGTNIKNKTLFETLDILVASNNLWYEYKNNILKVSAILTESFKVDYITSARQGTATISASVNSSPRQVSGSGGSAAVEKSDNQIVVKEEFDFWNTIESEIQAILNTGKELYEAKPPIINSKAGLITVTATKDQIARVEQYFNTLRQRLLKQVLIDVTILSVDLNDDNRMGVDWSKFKLGFFGESAANIGGVNSGATWDHLGSGNNVFSNSINLPIGKVLSFDAGVQFSLDGVFDFLKEKGKTSVVSNPKILTLNNQQALITVGDTINYQTRSTTVSSNAGSTTSEDITNYSIFIGILLNILPTVSDNNTIMLRINPSLSDFKYEADNQRQSDSYGRALPREIAPDTTEKKLSTVVSVSSGDTIVLGGLITNSVMYVNKGVPLLSSIPVLGYAFKHAGEVTKTRELVFIITPRVIGEDTSTVSPRSLRDLGYNLLER